MRAIKHTLTERWYAWENARQEAMSDAEIDLSGNGPAYSPAVEVRVAHAPNESCADGRRKDAFESEIEEKVDEEAVADAAKDKATRQRQGEAGSGAQTE